MKYQEIKTPLELFEFMEIKIKYGFVHKIDKKVYTKNDYSNEKSYEQDIMTNYFLQTPKELLKSGYEICFDQVEFARDWLKKHNYKVDSYYSNYHNHVFLVYEENGKFYYFEHTFPFLNGIHKFDSITELFDFYTKKQIEFQKEKGKEEEIKFYKYQTPKFGSSFSEFLSSIK